METKTIVIERTFSAPVSEVWKAWTDANTLKQWWGPKTYTCPEAFIDFKVGRKFLAAMEDSTGKRMWTTGNYIEIVPDKRIVMTDSFSDSEGNIIPGDQMNMPGEWPDELLITLEFQEHAGMTLFLLKHEGLPPEGYDDCLKGWQEFFDKLDRYFILSALALGVRG